MSVAVSSASVLAAGRGSNERPADERPAFGTIRASRHDFSAGSDSPLQEICLPCHLPEDETPPRLGPLWDPRPQARQRFELYRASDGSPGSVSLVCLSCHDGSTAPDVYGGMRVDVIAIGGGDNPAAAALRKEALRRDHPVGVSFPSDLVRFRPRSQVEAEGFVTLPSGRVECLSCHDVHSLYGGQRLLVRPLEDGLLCLTCHRK